MAQHDFIVPNPTFRDVALGLAKYVVAAIRYRTGYELRWTLRQQIDIANVNRQLGPARLAEIEAYMSETEFEAWEDDWLDT